MNLSFGDRPVCVPVLTTSGPSAAIMPSPSRTAASYSAAVDRFATILPARTRAPARGDTGTGRFGRGLGHGGHLCVGLLLGGPGVARGTVLRSDRPRVTSGRARWESASAVVVGCSVAPVRCQTGTRRSSGRCRTVPTPRRRLRPESGRRRLSRPTGEPHEIASWQPFGVRFLAPRARRTMRTGWSCRPLVGREVGTSKARPRAVRSPGEIC